MIEIFMIRITIDEAVNIYRDSMTVIKSISKQDLVPQK